MTNCQIHNEPGKGTYVLIFILNERSVFLDGIFNIRWTLHFFLETLAHIYLKKVAKKLAQYKKHA